MLLHLTARDDRFKSISFNRGLTLIVADVTQTSTKTDSRNGVGKSAIVELLHFLLGARVDKNTLVANPKIRDIDFELTLDWPTVDSGLTVRRKPSSPSDIILEPDISKESVLSGMPGHVSLTEWQQLIESDLFRLPLDHSGISGRAMLSLYMRRIRSHSFNEAVKTYPQQSQSEASANIAYLLGLDWQLASKYRELSARESMRQKLAQATKDPVFGRIVGRSAELRGLITVSQQRVQALEQQVAEFRVVPEYENLQREADTLDSRVRRTRADDAIDRRNLQDLEASLEEVVDPDVDYLETVYAQLGVILSANVQRRYEEVRDFHSSVIANRRQYLQAEINTLRERLTARTEERTQLGEQQAAILRTLNEGGALDSLSALQQTLTAERAALESLRHRFEAAHTLEASASEIRGERSQLESEMRADLRDRDSRINELNLRFYKYATDLYSADREAYLELDPTSTHLKIAPHIDSKGSRGINNMVMFCFDLTVAVTALRRGYGPDFLVHDSHLFDGVDERQVSQALNLAKSVAEEEHLQYIVTMNSDDLAKAERQGADVESAVIEPRLTDRYEDGGLFGFRFS
ncbi:MAG: ABC-three component system protein [Candidatus Binatia bacterium]